jgi:hypothetical protein
VPTYNNLFVFALCFYPMLTFAAEPATAPVEVMIVGVYHMSNPGQDVHNVEADDVLTPKRQAEIASLTDALARFRPDKIFVEWPAEVVAKVFPMYLAGTLPPSRNEVVQLGFRLAQKSGAHGVWGIDVHGDFPYDPVKAYADEHGLSVMLDAQDVASAQHVTKVNRILADGSISAALRYLNDPVNIKSDHTYYRSMLRFGSGTEQPGADLVSSWYRRNLLICANLVQLGQSGDRIVVFFGSGHSFLLRQCVSETPGLRLVEATSFMSR